MAAHERMLTPKHADGPLAKTAGGAAQLIEAARCQYREQGGRAGTGVRGKQLKKKRRASKDQEALIAQFKKMTEETMKLPVTKMPRMEVPVPAIVAQVVCVL